MKEWAYLKNKARFGLSRAIYPYVDYLFNNIIKIWNFQIGVIPFLGVSPPKFRDSWVAKYAPAVGINFIFWPLVTRLIRVDTPLMYYF